MRRRFEKRKWQRLNRSLRIHMKNNRGRHDYCMTRVRFQEAIAPIVARWRENMRMHEAAE